MAAARCLQVTQYVVGNGVPLSSNGACSVTAGRPNGQRRATRRNARGGRPSCWATRTRSSTAAETSPQPLPPLADALDDVQVLAGTDVSEPARLALEGGEARRD